jgi:hypothetical protein
MNIFNAASAVLYPFSGTTNMTISQVIFDNVSATNSACCRARLVWSAAYGVGTGNSPTARACGLLAQSNNGVNGATNMPIGIYPGGNGDAVTTGSPFVATGNTTDYYVIVADVTYSYQPGFGFQAGAWNQNANGGSGYTITQSTYMTPRNGATSPIQWTSAGTIAHFTNCSQGSGASQYLVP